VRGKTGEAVAANKFVLQQHQAEAGSAAGPLSFRRIVDVPFETCLAALDGWLAAEYDGRLRFGASQLLGPMEHDRDLGTRRIEVRLARGPLRPVLRMRLDIDRWSASSTALEMVPCGRVRGTAAYFRAGHLLLDSLTRALRQYLPTAQARDTASRAQVPVGSGPLGRDEVRDPSPVTAPAR
jgi:hypothetical protein